MVSFPKAFESLAAGIDAEHDAVEENEMSLFDDASRTFAKDLEALRCLVVDHIIPLGNHLRAQNSDGTKAVVLATEETLSFVSLENLAKQASKWAVSFNDDKREK